MRFRAATGEMDRTPRAFRQVRRNVARVKTVLNEKVVRRRRRRAVAE